MFSAAAVLHLNSNKENIAMPSNWVDILCLAQFFSQKNSLLKWLFYLNAIYFSNSSSTQAPESVLLKARTLPP